MLASAQMKAIFAVACAAFLGLGGGSARGAFITFEGLDDLTPVTTQYQSLGVSFQNATVLTAGVSLNELEFPPASGVNVAYDEGGPISLSFSAPISSFSARFTYAAPLEIRAFNSVGMLLGDVFSRFSSNLALSGELGSSPNELLGVSGLLGITLILIGALPEGASFTMDNVSFAVSEPAAVWLVAMGVLILSAWRKMRQDV
jgi:hypothetical protein